MASLRRLAPARLVLVFLCCLPVVALAIVGGAQAKKPDAPPGLAGKDSGPGNGKGHGGAGKAPRAARGGGRGKGHRGRQGKGPGNGHRAGHGKDKQGDHGKGRGRGRDDAPRSAEAKGKGGAWGRRKGRDGGEHAAQAAGPAPTAPAPGPPDRGGAGQGPAGAGLGRDGERRRARARTARREAADRLAAIDRLGRRLPGVPGARGGGDPASILDRLAVGARGSGGRSETGDDGGSGAPLFRLLSPGAAGRLAAVVPARVQWLAAALGALLSFLAFGTLLGWWRARRLERQRERLLEEVGLLQAALLPAVPERLGGLRASVAYRPWEGPGAGGDFYDAFSLGDHRVGLVIGDVSGHGREVLSRTAAIRYTLRAYLEAGLEPRAALALGGRVLDGNFDAGFATVMLAVHDAKAATLAYAAAGHPPPILLGPPAHDPVTACASPPIGAGLPTGLRQTTVAMPPGAVACFFTDGLVEARTTDGMLGRERFGALIEALGAGATAKELLARVVSRAEEVGDDMAVCLLRADPGRAAAPLAEAPRRTEELALEGQEIDSSAIQRFLWACGAPSGETRPAIAAARATAADSGGAVLRVEIGRRHARVEVVAPEEETSPAGRGHDARLAGVSG